MPRERARRVLLCSPDQRGGVSVFCRLVAGRLPGRVEPFLVGRRASRQGPVMNAARIFLDYARFALRLARGGVDLVHLNPSLDFRAVVRDAGFLLIAAAFRKRTLVLFHGWTDAFEANLRKRGLRLFTGVYNRADALAVLSPEFRSRLAGMGIARPVHLMTTLVDDALLDRFGDGGAGPRNGDGRCTILFMGRVEKDKGIHETLDAYAAVKRGRPDLRLIVAGDGSELGAAKRRVAESGIGGVAFTGWVDDAAKVDCLRRSDLYLFPTNHGEGIPISLLEAMAAGLPVVTRPMGGIGDFFEDRKMGYLVGAGDGAAVAPAVGALCGDAALRAAMGRYNHRYAREHFSASTVAARLERIYDEVADG